MSGDVRTARDADATVLLSTPLSPGSSTVSPSAHGYRTPASAPGAPAGEDSRRAVEIRGLVERGEMDEAREQFTGLVTAHQRRASRIAYQYLRDVAEADEAVQDAFVKVFTHITSYRETWPFEVWFTRILINGCLDRRKARARRERWIVPTGDGGGADDPRTTVAGPAEA